MAAKIQRIGILTAGGDSPGLNAAIRGVGKAALGCYGWVLEAHRCAGPGEATPDGIMNSFAPSSCRSQL